MKTRILQIYYTYKLYTLLASTELHKVLQNLAPLAQQAVLYFDWNSPIHLQSLDLLKMVH